MKETELSAAKIAKCIYKEMKTMPYNATQGLFGENFGALLFSYHYADFIKEKNHTIKLLNELNKYETNLILMLFYSGYIIWSTLCERPDNRC